MQNKLFAQNSQFTEFNESGAVILKRSIDTISQVVRVECNMRVSTFVNGVEFPAKGRYEEQSVAATAMEKDRDRERDKDRDKSKNEGLSNLVGERLSGFQRTMYRQELYFMTGGLSDQAEPNRVILVCYPNRGDSKSGNIWQFRSINGNKTLYQINIDAVEAAVKRSVVGENRENYVSGKVGEQVGGVDIRFSQVGKLWNVGGLAGVLGQIDRFYEFTELPKTETIEEGVKAIKLVGSMRSVYLEFLLSNQGFKGGDRYPLNLPSDIEVYIGLVDSFPRRIKYFNRRGVKSKPTTLLVEINYENVIINGDPIPEHRFSTFQSEVPAGVSKIDASTEQYIKSLGL
ncbi:MAG: hypothetical protein LBB88_09490 [Planctomycetaceae bacterium]|nr:hypothetical protein [Planctomycetaceae bacterium]